MPRRIRCPGCDAAVSVGDRLAGDPLKCDNCGLLLEVPEPASRWTTDERADRSRQAVTQDQYAHEPPVKISSQRELEDDMDMTPMADVTFLLLIFFMITATFTLQKSFEVPTPEDSQPQSQTQTLQDFENDPQYVVVRVDANNTYWVTTPQWEYEAPSKQELLIKLREARRPNLQLAMPTRMLVVANGEARHETVVAALDAGTAVGMEDVKLLTVEEDS